MYLYLPWCTVIIQVYRTFGYCHVLPCTLMYRDVSSNGERLNWWIGNQSKCWYIRVCTGMYWYIPVHTSTYCLILTGECVYLYILLYTVTSKYISVHTSSYQFILKLTGTYQYIPKHTRSYLSWSGFKKDANGFWTQDLLHTVRMLSHCTARVQTPDTGCVTMEMFVSILTLCIILPVYLTLDIGSTAPVPLRPRLRRPWRPQLLDWNLTIARPCLRSPSLTFGWVQLTRMSSRCSVQNAGNSASGSTSASVSARGPLAAVTMCWAGLSIKHFDTKK